jgi:hypothetical protein
MALGKQHGCCPMRLEFRVCGFGLDQVCYEE